MNELILSTVLGLIFIIVGILSKITPTLIAGYDINKPDKEAPKRIRDVMVTIGCVILAGCTVSFVLKLEILFWIFLIVSPIIMPFFVIYKSKKLTYIWGGIIIIMIIFFSYASISPSIKIDHEKISISGLYGESIPLKNINNIELLDSIPNINLRTNGFTLANIRKGYFLVENMGLVKIFMQSKNQPFIKIKTNNSGYIINTQKASETIDIYKEMVSHCKTGI